MSGNVSDKGFAGQVLFNNNNIQVYKSGTESDKKMTWTKRGKVTMDLKKGMVTMISVIVSFLRNLELLSSVFQVKL